MGEEGQGLRRTRSEVSLPALAHNLRCFRQAVGQSTKLMLVVKADAYGHGMLEASRVAQQEGLDWLGVGIAEEGVALWNAGIRLPILVFGAQNRQAMAAAARHGLAVPLCSPDQVPVAQSAAEAAGRVLEVHVKVDSGMGRLGVRTQEELSSLLDALKDAPMLRLGGVFTHFADADNPDPAYTLMQCERFGALAAQLPESLLRHAAATSGMLAFPEARLDMVRLGIGAYGYPPVPTDLPLKPVLRLLAEVSFVKNIRAGDCISYGCSFRAEGPMRVATLAIGYGDGYHRALSNKGYAILHGKRCPILGRVCMDQMMVDVSKAPETVPGDEALLLGRRGPDYISADELGELAGSISYEMLLSLKPRVPRSFINENEE